MKRLVAWSVMLFASAVSAQRSDAQESPAHVSSDPKLGTATLAEHRVAYRDALTELVPALRRRYLVGSDDIRFLLSAQKQLMEAELAVVTTPEERVRAIKHYVTEAEKMESDLRELLEEGRGRTDEYHQAAAAAKGAQILYLEETEPDSPKLEKLKVAYKDALRELITVLRRRILDGSDNISFLMTVRKQDIDAEIALSTTPEERLRAIEQLVEAAEQAVAYQRALLKAGAVRSDQYYQAVADAKGAQILHLEETKPDSPKLEELRVAYRDALTELVAVLRRRNMDGSENICFLVTAEKRLVEAELAMATTPEGRLDAIKAHLNRAQQRQRTTRARLETGSGRKDVALQAVAAVRWAEILYLEEAERQAQAK